MKLTKRELWLMRQAFDGDENCDAHFDAWLNEDAADGGVSVADVLARDAPRDDTIAAAVAAEREACAALCIAQADRLEGPSDAKGIAMQCAGMICARAKP